MVQEKLQLRQVHVFEKVGQSGLYALKRTQPAMRFQQQDSILFIQNGIVFSEEGGPIDQKKIPAWLTGEIEKANKAALRECGWPRRE